MVLSGAFDGLYCQKNAMALKLNITRDNAPLSNTRNTLESCTS